MSTEEVDVVSKTWISLPNFSLASASFAYNEKDNINPRIERMQSPQNKPTFDSILALLMAR